MARLQAKEFQCLEWELCYIKDEWKSWLFLVVVTAYSTPSWDESAWSRSTWSRLVVAAEPPVVAMAIAIKNIWTKTNKWWKALQCHRWELNVMVGQSDFSMLSWVRGCLKLHAGAYHMIFKQLILRNNGATEYMMQVEILRNSDQEDCPPLTSQSN